MMKNLEKSKKNGLSKFFFQKKNNITTTATNF